ncbi:MAG: hypothetical protein KatS3mg078_2003 [Deltaproteobacteria bacterium]|jgi:glycosyltransferase involved in cell wall biosynthesis|nr:MAG: hypothetical protein KatS3mg078_2003 [Deltaproteobacteria bacterium]
MVRDRLIKSLLIILFVLVTLGTDLLDHFRIYGYMGFSQKQVITTQKLENSEHEAIHFLLGVISGYLFDTWVAALVIGGVKEIYDFGYNYYKNSINSSQIVHDGILDPLFWVLGGFVGVYLLVPLRGFIRRIKKGYSPPLAVGVRGAFHRNPDNPLVSVVVPALDEEGFIERTLTSLLNQDFKGFEIIVVDNNSSDRTAEIAKQFGARVVFEPRQGVGYSRQAGFMAARAPVVATTDADTILPPNWISRILKEFESDPDLVAFGGLYYLYNGPFLSRLAVRYLIAVPWLFDRVFSGGWSLPGANLAVRRDAFLRVGGFNTRLKLGEDADLSQRLKHVGKVKLDMGFRVWTSGRRYRWGLLFAMFEYFPNALARIFLGNPERFSRLSKVREEEYSSVGYWLSWIALCLLLFTVMVPLRNPRVEAFTRPIKERAISIKEAISTKERDLIYKIRTKKTSGCFKDAYEFKTRET